MTRLVTLSFPVDDPEITEIMHQTVENLASLATYRNENGIYDGDEAAAASGGVVVSATDGKPIAGEKVEGAPATKAPIKPTPKAPVEPAAKPTETEGPEKTDDAPAIDPKTPLDSMGQPHDSRIHAKSKTKCDKAGKFGPGGIWKVSRGTDPARVEEVRAQWIANGYGPHLVETETATPAAPAAHATTAAPAAPVAEPKRRLLTPEERLTDAANGVSYQAFKDVVPPWTDQALIDAGKMLAEADSWVEDTDDSDTLELTGANAFTTLVVSVCNPALENGLITQEGVDGIVTEVTGGVATAVSLIPATHMEEHIPEIVKRINTRLNS